jgi:hypothetical protein
VKRVSAAEDQRGRAHQHSDPITPSAENTYSRRYGKQQIDNVKRAFSVFHDRFSRAFLSIIPHLLLCLRCFPCDFHRFSAARGKKAFEQPQTPVKILPASGTLFEAQAVIAVGVK